ncbi:MAG: hypothetical protein RL701_5969 [Pseudomonadota bacterium]
MNKLPEQALHLTSKWFIQPGRADAVDRALDELVAAVQTHEPDTLVYMAHRPLTIGGLQALPPSDANTVVFFEIYRDVAAFQRHVSGPVFTRFVAQHADLFVAANGKPFTFVEFLELRRGFVRGLAETAAQPAHVGNQHPALMFELLANHQATLLSFYRSVFGWQYDEGSDGFAYVRFPIERVSLLGGIGQANPNVKGWAAGHNFYLRVDDLPATIQRVQNAGGSLFVDPVQVDGYTFAMVKDPEGNVIGLIKPFAP